MKKYLSYLENFYLLKILFLYVRGLNPVNFLNCRLKFNEKPQHEITIQRVFIGASDPRSKYILRQAPVKKIISKMTGEQLSKEGFNVGFKDPYGSGYF